MHGMMAKSELKTKEDAVRFHLMRGDEHYLEAGQILRELKAYKQQTKAMGSWDAYVKKQFNIGKTRADDLIRIANGHTTIEEIRKGRRESVTKSQANLKAKAATQPATTSGRSVTPKPTPAPEPVTSKVIEFPKPKETIIPDDYAPLHETPKDCDTPEDFFHRSVENHMAPVVAMRAYWTKQFGDWRQFSLPSCVLTLAKDALEELTIAVAELSKLKQGE